MSILPTDLKDYQSANMPQDDLSASGGAIALAGRVEFTDLSATGTIDYVSDGTDTRTITVTGRDATGLIVSEAIVLTSAVLVLGATSFERILKAVLSTSDPSRTVTLTQHSGGATLATLGPTMTSTVRIFYNSASSPTGAVTRYEKLFLKNTNATLTLNSAQVTLTADPTAKLSIGLATAKNDAASTATRLTAPAGVTFVGLNTAINVPTGVLAAAEAIGVWVEQSLLANDPPMKSTFTVQLQGTTV